MALVLLGTLFCYSIRLNTLVPMSDRPARSQFIRRRDALTPYCLLSRKDFVGEAYGVYAKVTALDCVLTHPGTAKPLHTFAD
jgi:hypothetical protein